MIFRRIPSQTLRSLPCSRRSARATDRGRHGRHRIYPSAPRNSIDLRFSFETCLSHLAMASRRRRRKPRLQSLAYLEGQKRCRRRRRSVYTTSALTRAAPCRVVYRQTPPGMCSRSCRPVNAPAWIDRGAHTQRAPWRCGIKISSPTSRRSEKSREHPSSKKQNPIARPNDDTCRPRNPRRPSSAHAVRNPSLRMLPPFARRL